jgi:hypothetical protein
MLVESIDSIDRSIDWKSVVVCSIDSYAFGPPRSRLEPIHHHVPRFARKSSIVVVVMVCRGAHDGGGARVVCGVLTTFWALLHY